MKLIYVGSQRNLLENYNMRNTKIKKTPFNSIFITKKLAGNEIVV